MGYIFISYSHKDKDYVYRLQEALQKEGFEVWIDSSIDYGTRWSKTIQDQLDSCDAFLVVVSENSYESEWVQNEVARAGRKKKPFFPLLLNGDPWLSVEATQYADVTDYSLPSEKFYQRLANITWRRKTSLPSSDSKLNIDSKIISSTVPIPSNQKLTNTNTIRPTTFLAGILVCVVALAFAFWTATKLMPMTAPLATVSPLEATVVSTTTKAPEVTEVPTLTLLPTSLPIPTDVIIPTPFIQNQESFSETTKRQISLGNQEILVGTAVRFGAYSYGCNTMETTENIPYTVFLITGPIEVDIEIYNGGWDHWTYVSDESFTMSLLEPKRDEVKQHPNYAVVGHVECVITTNSSMFSKLYFDKGISSLQSQQYKDAIIYLNTCAQINPSYADCYNALGMAYRDSGNFSQAILNHDKAIALTPYYDYYYERGVTYHLKSVRLHTAEYNVAIADFKSCVEKNPTYSNCINRLAMAYRDIGDYAQALPYHNQAIEISPTRADFYWERGITYQNMGNTEKANTDFQKARDLGYTP